MSKQPKLKAMKLEQQFDDGIRTCGTVYFEGTDKIFARCPTFEQAEQIVRAVNCHEGLVEALQVARKEIEAWHSGINTKTGLKDMESANVGACFGGLIYIDNALNLTRAQGGGDE